MSEIEVKIRDDKAMLYTPYNPEFVKRIKKFSDARWNSGENVGRLMNQIWMLPE